MAAKLEVRDATATRPRHEIPGEIAEAVERLGLTENIKQLDEEGYTVVRDAADPDFIDRFRQAMLKTGSGFYLLGRDATFVEAVLNTKVLALARFSLGGGFLLSQVAASVRPNGAKALPLHADQNWLPAPFPEHNYLLTCCWVTDEYTREGGCTLVCPGTHRHRRHPNLAEIADPPGAIPIECPPNSVAMWDGAVWHGNYPRTIDGERVVCHVTYSRMAMRPIEDYTTIDDELIETYGATMAQLFGRNDFLWSPTGTDFSRVGPTFATARS